jgi:hypothetical protein
MEETVTERQRRSERRAGREIRRIEEDKEPKLVIYISDTKTRSRILKGGEISAELFVIFCR